MNVTLVLAGVSALLKARLENGLVALDVSHFIGGDALVTLLPPNRVKAGPDERPQINLFLYQVALRGVYPTNRFRTEEEDREASSLPQPPLELSYLLTAYGAQDFQSEILLGAAQSVLQQRPLLVAEDIARALSGLTLGGGGMTSPASAALSAPEVARAYESVLVTPQILTLTETQHLWSLLQAPFRVSLSYKAVVTLRVAVEKAPA